MNKKMGVLPVNGTAKREGKKYRVNGLVNGSGKRKVQEETSDSEQDSKSKLVMKSASKKMSLSTETKPKQKKKSSEVKVHKTISQTTSTSVVSTIEMQDIPQSLTMPIPKPILSSPKTTTLKPPMAVSSADTNADPGGSQQRATTNGSQLSESSGPKTDKNRRKKGKKRLKEKQKKLEEMQLTRT